jgi:hypothetical protein
MGLLHLLRQRLSDSLHHHPPHVEDPALGPLEQVADGLWRTLEPIAILPDAEPLHITIEGDEHGPAPDLRPVIADLQRRYDALRPAIEPLLRNADPRSTPRNLWPHAALEAIEIWRHPTDNHPVLALHYALDDFPEYTFVVRLEHWTPIDVLVTG